MTTNDVKNEVELIEELAHDNEAAHGKEDELHQAVLLAIADGADNPAELAREALKTTELGFARWCA